MFESVESNVEERKMHISDDIDIVDDDDDITDTSSYKSAPSHPLSPETQENSVSGSNVLIFTLCVRLWL